MWGIIPAAGSGSRIQPLAFSKELLPVGRSVEGDIERPRAVSEYLIDRMTRAGVVKICLVISPAKSDIMRYYGGGNGVMPFCYSIQQQPHGLCDAIFRALPFIHESEQAIVGLPDTVWFPEDALSTLPDNNLSFLLFPVESPEFYDAVETDSDGRVLKIKVKDPCITSRWIWGAFKAPGHILNDLFMLWTAREKRDVYIGTLVNAYIENGGIVTAVRAGKSYVDVGTLNGYREALRLLYATGEQELQVESPGSEL